MRELTKLEIQVLASNQIEELQEKVTEEYFLYIEIKEICKKILAYIADYESLIHRQGERL